MFNSRRLRMIEAALVLLFFIQAWRAVAASLFGILYDYGFEGRISLWAVISVVLVLLAFAAPLAAPRRYVRLALMLGAVGAAIARPALNVDSLWVRYWGGLAVLAMGGIYLAGLVRNRPRAVVTGVIGALAADQLLRALGHTYDPGVNPIWLLPFSLLALMLVIISILLFVAHPDELLPKSEPGKLSVAGGLALGAVLFVETSLLALPNAVARWSNFEYAVIAPVFVAATCVLLLIQVRRRAGRVLSNSRWSGILLAGLVLAGLWLGDKQLGAFSALGLLIAHLAVLMAFLQVAETNPARRPERIGLWLTLGLWLMFALTFALNLAFTYAYTLPFMRGMGLPVYLAAGLIAAQAALTCGGSEPAVREHAEYRRLTRGLIAMAAATIIVAVVAFPLPARINTGPGPFTAATFTIRYGYDSRWHYSLDPIAQAIEQSGADIITLQEVDTGRLTSYGADDILYLARRLRMQAVYLPTIEHVTGIAILYRLPEVEHDFKMLTSTKEQTGVLHVHLRPGEYDLHVYGTWLGIRGENTSQQVQELVQFIGDKRPTILGGAFFVLPGSDVYLAIKNAGFDFPAFGQGMPLPGREKNADYVWTRGLAPLRGWTPEEPAMNHAMVAVQFE